MAKIKNVSGEDRTLPWLNDRLVLAGQVIDVPDDDVFAYTQQTAWDAGDDEAQAITDKLSKAEAVVADAPAHGAMPAGNASRAEWAEFALSRGVDPGSRIRDEIRELFTTKEN